jgi:O-antigen ligase
MAVELAAPAPLVGRQGSVRRNLVLLSLAALPFTYALTLNLRFPLKLYELALAFTLLTCLLDLKLKVAPGTLPVARRLAWFVAVAAALTLLRFALPAEGASVGFGTRFGPAGDAIAKLVYLVLAIGGMLLFSRVAYTDQPGFLRAWIAGALIASAYSWYLGISGLAGLDPVLLPGMEDPKYAAIGGRAFIRSGTFQEGNFLGLYLLVSTGVALYARRPLAAALLAATTLWTFSTVNVLGLALLGAMLWWRANRGLPLGRRVLYLTLAAVVGAAVVALLFQTGYVQSVVFDKLGGDESTSKVKRLAQMLAGIRMFLDHPFLGVGISQFGYYYNHYQPLGALGVAQTVKLIPNNIYVELLAELGILGLVLFAGFLLLLYRRLRAPGLVVLRLTFVATLLAFNAFPTYSVMFLWAFFGLILGASARADAARVPAEP